MSTFEPSSTRLSTEGTLLEQGLRIVSFDGGGPGSYSQMLMLKEFIKRLEWDNLHEKGVNNEPNFEFDEEILCPADYFDLMGGVGFGAYCALMLGRLCLPIERAIDELVVLAQTLFPDMSDEILTAEVNSEKLKSGVEDMLQRNGFPIDLPLVEKNEQRCKVVVFIQATSIPGNCTPFRTYPIRSSHGPICTFVAAACAALSELPHFSPVMIGPKRREISYAGIPLGFNNPTRKVLNEARMVFGDEKHVSLILSLGGGKSSTSSIRLSASFKGNDDTILTRIVMDSKRVDDELSLQLSEVDSYLRLDVDRGLEDIKTSDWHELGTIGVHTYTYLDNTSITTSIDKSLHLIYTKKYLTFAQLNGAACHASSKVPIEQMLSGLVKEVKDMRDIMRQGEDMIRIVDFIGNHISIPLEYCVNYEMLKFMIDLYFRHQGEQFDSILDEGSYTVISRKDRWTVKPGEWMDVQVPNLMLDTGVVVKRREDYRILCPNCKTEFQLQNGWAICPNRMCKMKYQSQVNWHGLLGSEEVSEFYPLCEAPLWDWGMEWDEEEAEEYEEYMEELLS